MRIIVTGGAGYIGTHLIEELLKRNYQVLCVDNLSNSSAKKIKRFLNHENFSFLKKHCCSLDKKDTIFDGVDAIFHLASNCDPEKSVEKGPDYDLSNTFLSTFHMLEIARMHKIKDFIFASSSTIYGDANVKLTENYGPCIPVSHYGAGKLASEAFINSYAENFDMRTYIIRFPNVCGNKMTHGVITNLIKQMKDKSEKLKIYGTGVQSKPYIHVNELIEAIMFIWFNSARRKNIYNVGPETQTMLIDIAKWVMQEYKEVDIEYVPTYVGDISKYEFNIEKLRKLGFNVKLSSDDAVRRAIKENL